MNLHSHRKDEHVMIAEKLYRKKSSNGLEGVRLIPANLPEISLDEVSLSTTLAGKKIEAPFFINAITGGSETTDRLNEKLAMAAAATGLAMAVGSQSIALKDPAFARGFERLRSINQDGIMLANLGAGHPLKNAEQAVRMISADALELHLNAAQELVMPEGDSSFYWLDNLVELKKCLNVPVLIKEVGSGMTPQTLKILAENNFSYVDLAGSGGTNFAAIENERRKGKETLSFMQELGLTTAETLLGARKHERELHGLALTASGGIRNAEDIVKCLVLGAENVGISGMFLHVLIKDGTDGLIERIEELKLGVRTLMALLGCRTVSELKKTQVILSGELKNTVEQL
ncbi:type 2 isopentenyl-diphosphate Delta-isomerase [Ligilactobacillus sp.]|uniref:type 2 isopentenyl-diphosphate Delta-isomerase n=1 Tax=Ligilactobacillus sp. TaxID=2767921 RepID=UPI002FE0E9A4